MPGDYRFKLQLQGGSYLPEHLKLGYLPAVGSSITVGEVTYEVLSVSKVKDIIYKIRLEELSRKALVKRNILRKIGGKKLWQRFRTFLKIN